MLNFSPSPGRLPDGARVYAVGDVHGCAERLAAMHRMIAGDLASRPIAAATLVHLGDYVDRGPDSAGVVRLLAAGPPAPGLRVVSLMGNHEAMMLAALAGTEAGAVPHWLANGAAASLASWGASADDPPERWREAVPARDRALLAGLALHHAAGGYLFVHAGIRPGVPVARQSREDLLWMREPFLSHRGDLGAVVVHGHTPAREPQIRANRIGLDTGAVLGGPLTCAVLEADRVAFLFG
ncbi:MAG TPA: metallophosphoesterase family protein [Acetobacteraceae bacterium]|nr:metallophosphoesterase family protein [Acetobacteraceae bacterium]